MEGFNVKQIKAENIYYKKMDVVKNIIAMTKRLAKFPLRIFRTSKKQTDGFNRSSHKRLRHSYTLRLLTRIHRLDFFLVLMNKPQNRIKHIFLHISIIHHIFDPCYFFLSILTNHIILKAFVLILFIR